MNDDKDMPELIDEWCRHTKAYHWEGSAGVRRFAKLCEVLGYRDGHFIGADRAIENFLADNPGAVEALIEWISSMDIDEWKENLESELPEEEEEEEEDEDADE